MSDLLTPFYIVKPQHITPCLREVIYECLVKTKTTEAREQGQHGTSLKLDLHLLNVGCFQQRSA